MHMGHFRRLQAYGVIVTADCTPAQRRRARKKLNKALKHTGVKAGF